MDDTLNEFPWATACIVALTVIAAVAGAAVVVFGDPGALPFDQYLKYMAGYAAALGLLGIGRGIRAHAKMTYAESRTHRH